MLSPGSRPAKPIGHVPLRMEVAPPSDPQDVLSKVFMKSLQLDGQFTVKGEVLKRVEQKSPDSRLADQTGVPVIYELAVRT